jgi:hypothetical protein
MIVEDGGHVEDYVPDTAPLGLFDPFAMPSVQ